MATVEIQYKATKNGSWKDHDFINLHNVRTVKMYGEIAEHMANNYNGARESAYRFNAKEHVIYFKNDIGESFKVDLTPLGMYNN